MAVLVSTRLLRMAAVVTAFTLAWRAIAADQPPAPPAGIVLKNLQVLPKNIKPEQLVVVMHKISTGLGVDCDFCHAPAKLPPGKTLPPGADPLDYSLDDKPTKRTARQMLVMVNAINAMVPAAVGKPAEKTESIQCFNCHRGMMIPPLPLADVLDRTTAEKGRAAAIAQYRELRSKYGVSGAYDFGDATAALSVVSGLEGYASQLALLGKSDDALAWLHVNLEYYPKSAATWAAIAFVQAVGKHDKAEALISLKKAVALAPQTPQFKDALKFLEALPP
jgi:hypothetical protein